MNTFHKILTFFGLLVPFASSASSSVERDFQGLWEWEDTNPNGTPYATLSLELKQEGAKISGVYCYIARSGSRIDCPDEGSNVSGSATGEFAILTIRSSYFDENFKARIEIAADSLSFNVIERIHNERFFAPKDVVLRRHQ